MKKELKAQIIEQLTSTINEAGHVYITNIESLNAEQTANLRRECFKQNIRLEVVKNTLLRQAFDRADRDFSELYPILKGATSVMFCNEASVPAKMIQTMRKKSDKPVLKGAYVEEAVFIGDDQIKALTTVKSKYELIGEVIGLLESPAKNLISALQSAGGTLSGLLKTLSEKE
ncbi:MAG: RplJ, ribosomal protein [Bacteroidota bacterium]|jgi:large subunit ribosomal protein L10